MCSFKNYVKDLNGLLMYSIYFTVGEICFVCGKAGKWSCSNEPSKFFCDDCIDQWHNHPDRLNHTFDRTENNAAIEIGTLQLLSVLCIETSHYVCFTRIAGSHSDDWIFFDSMAERPGTICHKVHSNTFFNLHQICILL